MSSFRSALEHFQSLGPAVSVALTRELDVETFRARIAEPAIVEATDQLLGAVLGECYSRHGAPGGAVLRRHNPTVFLLAYLISGYHADVFDDRLPDYLRQHVLTLSRSLTWRFDAIVAAAAESTTDLPEELTRSFAEEVFAHAASFEAWSTFDADRLARRIRHALEALYHAMWIAVDQRPDLLLAFDTRIVQLRAYLRKYDRTTGRAFLADEEMRRMQHVVLRLPSVLGTFVAAQRRARLALGLRRTRAVRGKLAVFRQAVDRGDGPASRLNFELFAMVAERAFC